MLSPKVSKIHLFKAFYFFSPGIPVPSGGEGAGYIFGLQQRRSCKKCKPTDQDLRPRDVNHGTSLSCIDEVSIIYVRGVGWGY